jgi:glycerophosphoryl diester phosphodiesterase
MTTIRAVLALTLLTVLAAATPAAAAPNPWLDHRVLNMTHQGGEDEHPSGTMFALRESLALGADMLELDVQPTKEGTLMVLHDAPPASRSPSTICPSRRSRGSTPRTTSCRDGGP